MNLTCYGVRETEVAFFEKLNKYNYTLTLCPDLLNDDNVELCKGADAVMVRGNCKADANNIQKMADYGVKYLLTRTVGYNHVDLEAASGYGIKVARVPGYSPNAIAELALTLAMMLLRNTAYTVEKTQRKDFTVDAKMFSREVRNCTVGIIGTGKIGLTTAKLFKGLGAKVIAYDIYHSDEAKEVVEFVEMDTLITDADIISIHMPYFKGKNDKVINGEFLAKMKDAAILINTSRGEIQDDEAILSALESGKLAGFGTDVFATEAQYFFKNFEGKALPDTTVEKLISLYPKVLVTPHIGSYTDEALTNMVEFSYENLNDFVQTGKCDNAL